MNKPYSESCDQNREPILAVLREVFADRTRVLELGSGTGQHAAWFPQHLPHLHWQPSDLPGNLLGIRLWLEEATLSNVADPIAIDANDNPWPGVQADAVFTANTFHIMGWEECRECIAKVGALLPSGGVFAIYGPFNYEGRFTSESNARFQDWLKARDPRSGIRDFEAIARDAAEAGMDLLKDYEMPANNRTLVFRKLGLR
ncbi:MAG: DUF938 domain-containing protein [Gammaproteobacteria bacterium]